MLLKTKKDLFFYLTDQKFEFLYKAQEAEDLKNPDAAEELRVLAGHIAAITIRLREEMEETK